MIFDAIVVGSGPAGATVASLLSQAGWSVAIVEKKTFPRRKVCGEFISATSLPLLERLGIADFYLTHSGPEIRRVGFFAADALLSSVMPPVDRSVNHWGRALGREHLDSALLNIAVHAGAKLWQPWNVKAVQRNGDLFTCAITSGDNIEKISARTIIMAHGSWERSIVEPHITYPHKKSDLLAFKAHFKHSDLATDLMPLLAFPGGYGGMVHTDNGRITLSCCIRRDVLQNIRQQYPGLSAAETVLKHIQLSCLGVRQALKHAERDGEWLAVGPIRPGIRKCYTDGIFFVGNTVGEAHPIVAEGISMAMQSAWLLSQNLLTHQNKILAAKNYTQQWHANFAKRIYAASLFAQFAMRPSAVALLLPILKKFPGLLTFGAKLSGKTTSIESISIEKESAI
ncbi:MAG TPA: NAD(P)/FAD-dependent oxidoreductase [Gammaproteobacteria bacterium]|nr:NAD(P)/FAD-dependent oxidoreductase [Gammaproteobacteria bacterium]